MARDFRDRKIRQAKRKRQIETSAENAPSFRRKKDGKVFRLKMTLSSGELIFHDYDGKFDPSYFERV